MYTFDYMRNDMTQSVSIRLDDEVLGKLDMLTKATERSRAWLMAHAVEQYVQHEAWQIGPFRTHWIKSGKAMRNSRAMKRPYSGCKAGAAIRN